MCKNWVCLGLGCYTRTVVCVCVCTQVPLLQAPNPYAFTLSLLNWPFWWDVCHFDLIILSGALEKLYSKMYKLHISDQHNIRGFNALIVNGSIASFTVFTNRRYLSDSQRKCHFMDTSNLVCLTLTKWDSACIKSNLLNSAGLRNLTFGLREFYVNRCLFSPSA